MKASEAGDREMWNENDRAAELCANDIVNRKFVVSIVKTAIGECCRVLGLSPQHVLTEISKRKQIDLTQMWTRFMLKYQEYARATRS